MEEVKLVIDSWEDWACTIDDLLSRDEMPHKTSKTLGVLTIFRWRDVLFPDKFASPFWNDGNSSSDGKALDENSKVLIGKVEAQSIKLLKTAAEHGHVWILSNFSMENFKASIDKFMPKLRKFLKKNEDILLLSSRDAYKKEFPKQYSLWKEKTIKKEIRRRFPFRAQRYMDLFMIGNGLTENQLAKTFVSKYPEMHVQSISVTDGASCTTLAEELRFIRKAFPDIQKRCGSMELSFAIDSDSESPSSDSSDSSE